MEWHTQILSGKHEIRTERLNGGSESTWVYPCHYFRNREEYHIKMGIIQIYENMRMRIMQSHLWVFYELENHIDFEIAVCQWYNGKTRNEAE